MNSPHKHTQTHKQVRAHIACLCINQFPAHAVALSGIRREKALRRDQRFRRGSQFEARHQRRGGATDAAIGAAGDHSHATAGEATGLSTQVRANVKRSEKIVKTRNCLHTQTRRYPSSAVTANSSPFAMDSCVESDAFQSSMAFTAAHTHVSDGTSTNTIPTKYAPHTHPAWQERMRHASQHDSQQRLTHIPAKT